MDVVDGILDQWAIARPDLDVRAMGPVGRLGRIAHHFSVKMGATFAEFGLNAAGFDVLATLRRSDPPHALAAGDLMTSMMITSGTMTNRIDQLEKSGLVERGADPADGRRTLIRLTPKGFALIDQVVERHVATQESLLSILSESEIRDLDALLKTMLIKLEAAPSKPDVP
ncbi:MAG: MarR family transcriptional regulator [Pseudomonadota bacterium]